MCVISDLSTVQNAAGPQGRSLLNLETGPRLTVVTVAAVADTVMVAPTAAMREKGLHVQAVLRPTMGGQLAFSFLNFISTNIYTDISHLPESWKRGLEGKLCE